ncbi:MAG TPA: ATP-binding protein [Mycobacteriales bacterium]|nr:ATP-binding protein [Mycobacteriales bacterium]
MEISLSLAFPRDLQTVPVARHIVDASMVAVGVTEACSSDVALALTEACTNVVDHSGPGEEYEVRFALDNEVCSITVVDMGQGFDPAAVSLSGAEADAESGRGFQLMRHLVDDLRFESNPQDGSTVTMLKTIEYAEGSLLAKAIEESADSPA